MVNQWQFVTHLRLRGGTTRGGEGKVEAVSGGEQRNLERRKGKIETLNEGESRN